MAKAKSKASSAAKRRSRKRKLDSAKQAEERRITALLDSATTQRYGDTERVLGDEMRRVGAHGATIDSAYTQYQQQVAQLAAQQQQAMAQAAQAQAQTAQGVAAGQAALGTGQQAATQQTAQRYGLDGGQQAAEAAQLAGQLGAVQGARGQAQAGTSAAIGLAQADRIRSGQIAGAGAHVKSKERNADELKLLFGKQMDLAADKGAFRTTLRHEIDKQEAEQALAEAALGVKARDADRQYELDALNTQIKADENRARSSDRAADNRRADRKLAADIEHKARTRAQRDRELDQKAQDGAEPAPKLTAAKQNEWRQKKARIMELQRAFQAMSESGRFKNTAQISVHLRKNGGANRIELNMARDLFANGRLSAANIQAAKSYFPGGYIPGGFTAGRS